MIDDSEQLEDVDEITSKSQVKRDVDALVDLGKTVAGLSAKQFEAIPLSEGLRGALKEARKLTKGGALKRQFKYIAKLLRDINVESLHQALEKQLDKDRAATARLHTFEQWRDRLVEGGDDVLSEFLSDYPMADRQHIRQLQRKAKQEQERQKPPAAARKIFQYIRDMVLAD
ncbi:MAG: hypothetical protein A6F71_01295 [Cycloclasticus sp. symbiont of Poecilosclerida sp. M]|nr:MAG: hypothetical protein A6F71_01295 [Cycloclasticus sp. symbiont of Poecilosclerida sp. M]